VSANRFLPDPEIVPQHDTPGVAFIDPADHVIPMAIAKLHSLAAAAALGAGQMARVELRIMGYNCALTGDVIGGHYLAETFGHELWPRPKMFFLIPLQEGQMRISSLRIEDETFDTKYTDPAKRREMRWYVMGVLLKALYP